ncbi:hypothetical protein [Roseiterribacter gracilis]|uniref:DUF1269 domain-containing protein n=1 Tax=Roseiterribacter gracilis TaxID=2812848 RepID=A0A8S8X6G9_9PROT|nr:hypothetical protein TMPK1_05600 [Rhodospirillales bacterium TMPK1]
MAIRTLAALYDDYGDAAQAIAAIEAAGIAHSDVSIIANNADNRYRLGSTNSAVTDANTTVVDEESDASGLGTGATIGTIVGGGAGLLAGLGMLAIPGVGPVIAAGWLVATLAGAGVGAAVGGLVGSLTDAGVDNEHAVVYAEGVRRGGTLVTVRVDDLREAEIRKILDHYEPVDIETRGAEYRSSGWSPDTTATTTEPYRRAAE